MKIEKLKELTIAEIRNVDIESLNKVIVYLKNIVHISDNSYKAPRSLIFTEDPNLEKICVDKFNHIKLNDFTTLNLSQSDNNKHIIYLIFSLTNTIQKHYQSVENAINNNDTILFSEIGYLLPNLFKNNTYKYFKDKICSHISSQDLNFYEVLFQHSFFNIDNKCNQEFIIQQQKEYEILKSAKHQVVNPQASYNIKQALLFQIHYTALNDKVLHENLLQSPLFDKSIYMTAIESKLSKNIFYTIEPSILVDLIKDKGYFLSPQQITLIAQYNKTETLDVLFKNKLLENIDSSEDMQTGLLNCALLSFSTGTTQYLINRYPNNEIYNNISLGDFIMDTDIKEFFLPKHSHFRQLCLNQYLVDEDFLNNLSNQVNNCHPEGLKDFLYQIYEKDDEDLIHKVFSIFKNTFNPQLNDEINQIHNKYLLKLELLNNLSNQNEKLPKIKI